MCTPHARESFAAAVAMTNARHITSRTATYLIGGAFLAVSLFTFTWRVMFIPASGGDRFGHVVVCGLVLLVMAKLHNLRPAPRVFAAITLLLTGTAISICGMYFRSLVAFSFVLIGVLLLGFAWLWSNSSKSGTAVSAVIALMLLLPAAYFCANQVRHARKLLELRFFSPELVSQVKFISPTTKPDVVVATRDKVAKIVMALHSTYPYGPYQESMREPRQVVISLQEGDNITFVVGQGNRRNPKTVWIEFDRGSYQNARLYKVLTSELKLPIWVDSTQKEGSTTHN